MLSTLKKLWLDFLLWREDRAYAAAKRRMAGCSHSVTQIENHGMDVRKCLQCWAIYVFPPAPDIGWTPNSARPRRRKEAR